MASKEIEIFSLAQKIYNCGGIILFNQDFTKTILVESHIGHHSFPKGKRERGENLYQTAIRETEEETGLIPEQYLMSDFVLGEYKKENSLTPSVLYFIGQIIGQVKNFKYDKTELKNVGWVLVEKALKMDDQVFVEKRRRILAKALEEVKKEEFRFYTSEEVSKNSLMSRPKTPPEITPEDLENRRLTAFSKTMSWALRHKAIELGLDMDQEGYVLVDQLLGIKELEDLDFPTLEKVVQTNKKNRFKLIERDSQYYVRANQGHSQKVGQKLEDHKMLKELTLDDDIKYAYHGTSLECWNKIKNEGLKPGQRKHCHLSKTYYHEGNEIVNGIRGYSQVILKIDLKKGIERGLHFYLSDNDVILSAFIPVDLLERVK